MVKLSESDINTLQVKILDVAAGLRTPDGVYQWAIDRETSSGDQSAPAAWLTLTAAIQVIDREHRSSGNRMPVEGAERLRDAVEKSRHLMPPP